MSESRSIEVLVVGAGVAGLAAARDLAAAGVEPLVVDAGSAPGGVMQTGEADGYRVEAGPNTFQAKAPLCAFATRHELWPHLVESAPESRRRSIFRDGRLISLPHGPVGAIGTPLVSTRAKLRLLAEPFLRRGDPTGESVHEFVSRRLGPEVATELVGAFLTGVYAGDERELGIEAVFPALAELEVAHGSLLRGGLARAFGSRRRDDPEEPARRGTWSSPAGLGDLARAMADGLPVPVRLQTRVTGLERDGSSWRIELSNGTDEEVVVARHVVVATPAYAASELLGPVEPAAATILAAIEYAPIVALGLGVDPADVRGDIDGFGFIVPRSAGARLLGCLFMSRLFEGRAPAGRELLHCMLGGVRSPGVVDLDDGEVVSATLADLDRALGLRAPPQTIALHRWPRAIPQPGREHVRQVAEALHCVHDLPGLTLAGSYVAGVSVADTLASGCAAASRVLEAAR